MKKIRFRISIRRPLCLAAVLWLAALLILQKTVPTLHPDLSAAQGRYLTVSGRILSKETGASSLRLLLTEVSFPNPSGSVSAVYRNLLKTLRRNWPSRGRVTVYLDAGQSSLYREARIGNRITVKGKCFLPEPPTNPGQFDGEQYDHARSIYLKLSNVSAVQKDDRGTAMMSGSGIRMRPVSACLNLLADLRFRLREAAGSVFGPQDAALIDAIVLGDRSGLDSETKQLFQDGGILHILAVSSLHVTILGRSLYRLLRKLRRGFVLSSVCSGLLVVSYCLMTGNSFSAVRAAVMFLFELGAQITGRTCDRLTALAAAAVFLTVRHPHALLDTGFLLSFGCILSMELLTPVFTRIWNPKHSLLKRLNGSLALQAGILPLTLWLFYQTSPWSILLNLIVLPSMSLLMVFAVIGCLAGLLIPAGSAFLPAAQLLSGPCGHLLDLFRLLCRTARRLPGDVLIAGRPAAWKMILYYTALALVSAAVLRMDRKILRARKKQIRLFFPLLLTGLSGLLILHRKPAFRFTCLDVGQGSCCLIERSGTAVLFDGGSSSVSEVYRFRIESALKYYGISRLDLVFLSHGDKDHVSGISEMLRGAHPSAFSAECGGIRIGRILVPDLTGYPEEFSGLSGICREALHLGIPVSAVKAGVHLSVSGLSLSVLSPSPERMTGNTNEDCIVLDLRYGSIRILFPGDLEKEGEERFTVSAESSGTLSPSEEDLCILIAGHHGSRYATSDAFLSLVRPDLVLISCGRNNRYGHPAREMLGRLRTRNIPCIRTDRSGAFCLTLPE